MLMRVISGEHRGRVLDSPKHDIRPTLDKVKQALFTRLQFEIGGKKVLDLFSGSGALGIEALSRGASEVVFVDKNLDSIKLTKQNLKKLGYSGKVITGDALDVLKRLDETFDIILLDPPYKSGLYEKCLEIIKDRKLLNEGGIIVCERARDEKIDSQGFKLDCTKFYGTVALDYFI